MPQGGKDPMSISTITTIDEVPMNGRTPAKANGYDETEKQLLRRRGPPLQAAYVSLPVPRNHSAAISK